MAQASRDENFVTTLLAVSSVDGVTPVTLYADPVTHRLLVNLASGDGTVTDVSVVTANGFAGTVATSTTTPAITLSTTVNGIVKGNGTALSAATAGTDYTALAFKTIAVSGQSDIVADSAADTLTIAAGTGMTLTTNAGTDTLTIALTTDPTVTYATRALDNLASVAINTALLPGVSDSIALGSTGKMWSDLFLGDGAVINFNNGNVVLTHSTGVLTMGTGTLKITNPTDVATSVVTIDGTQTFTNKTFSGATNVLGAVTMTLGSDADGDIYYRSSNVLTRLAKGTATQMLQMNQGATAPQWASASGYLPALELDGNGDLQPITGTPNDPLYDLDGSDQIEPSVFTYDDVGGNTVIGADAMALIEGNWQTWTPNWINGISNIGNAVQEGRFARLGKVCVAQAKITLGSTTLFTTGEMWFTLPVPIASGVDSGVLGVTQMNDTGTAQYEGYIHPVSASAALMVALNSSGTYVTKTNATNLIPHTWAATDVIYLLMIYQID